jgi:NAD(P)-dependent dehydrogenase (short-subunit alcohol dehydrogenase family)
VNPAFLADRTALVTAASRNLGASIAGSLARHGATVAINYHTSSAEAQSLVDRLRDQTGRHHVAIEADVADASSVRRLVEEAASRLGGLDVLVNNAGPFSMTPYEKLSSDVWDQIVNTNLKAAYVASATAAAHMRSRGWGRIVNISAGSAYIRNHSVYGLAKSALMMLTQELALELAPEITVNAVAPGQIVESTADIAEIDPTFVDRAITHTPLKRLVGREEVAELVAYMCSPLLDFATGVTIPFDGGWRLNRF